MQAAFERGWRLYGSWTRVDPMFSSLLPEPVVAGLLEKMRVEVRAARRRIGMSETGN